VLFLIQVAVQIVHGRLFFLYQVLPAVGAEAFLQLLHVRPSLAGVVFRPFHGGKDLVEQCAAGMCPRLPKAGLCLFVCFVCLFVLFVVVEAFTSKMGGLTKSEKRKK
jgi:hypothetical protein